MVGCLHSILLAKAAFMLFPLLSASTEFLCASAPSQANGNNACTVSVAMWDNFSMLGTTWVTHWEGNSPPLHPMSGGATPPSQAKGVFPAQAWGYKEKPL